MMRKKRKIGILLALCIPLIGCSAKEKNYIINVSYDPTREFYENYNEMFVAHWKKLSGETIEVVQSHGGSGKQALFLPWSSLEFRLSCVRFNRF